MINVDMTRAKEIHKKKVRRARKKLFPDLDAQFQKALETSADTTSIESKKNALRDAPAAKAISDAKTPAELKAAWDTNLLGKTPYKS